MLDNLNLPDDVRSLLDNCKRFTLANTLEDLRAIACGPEGRDFYEVAFDVPGRGRVVEATVARVRNGFVANYPEPYMRRRDPDCMLIGDEVATDKKKYSDVYQKPFTELRRESLQWLQGQDLIGFTFQAGRLGLGTGGLVIAPANTGFFALGLGLLQGIISQDDLDPDFEINTILYVCPTFRHTHFDGKQMVIHRREQDQHEIFSYNLYPGPSAKKGIYGVLIGLGEREQWVTAHCSSVQVITPYDNITTMMHEGASGSGKSEMLEYPHREEDGRFKLGTNTQSGEELFIQFPRSCRLRPVSDDMALCHRSLQKGKGKLVLTDAEDSWFVRVNHIERYGADPLLEGLTANPPEPLLFLNIDAVPGSRALIWEHTMDAPGKPCPNPRVVLPRKIVPGIVEEPVSVDIRSFGMRTPPCSRENPTVGIIGLFHILPPSLAWLWRLASPRGHANPSIVEKEGMGSEGVGSYWPFATGRRVDQANLLLEHFTQHHETLHILVPNQHIGIWETGFSPQWVMREYMARRGHAAFRADQLSPSRCSLLGYSLNHLQVEGQAIPKFFLRVDLQAEVGEEGYDAGAIQLNEFFKKHLEKFRGPDINPLGARIIECFMDGGKVEDYQNLIPAAEDRVAVPA